MIINMNGAKAPETPSPVMQEKTVTPETLPVVIGADEGYDGLSQVTVNPDAQLKAENIRSGKSIFGVTGAFEGTVTQGTLLIDIMNGTVTTVTEDDLEGATNIPLNFFQYCKNLVSVDVPDTVTVIYSYAFQYSSIQHLKVSSNIETWGYRMCHLCKSLTDVVLPEGLTAIGGDMTFGYSGLTNIIIPSTVTTITGTPFEGCGFTSIVMKSINPPSIPIDLFVDASDNVVITVPKGSLEAYQTATNWSTYANKMVEATE